MPFLDPYTAVVTLAETINQSNSFILNHVNNITACYNSNTDNRLLPILARLAIADKGTSTSIISVTAATTVGVASLWRLENEDI